MLWERRWKKHLIALSDAYSKDTKRQNVIIEQLAGESNFQKPTDQAQLLPEATLQDIAIAAKTILLLTRDNSIPTQNFANIKQGVKETFLEFVDRLKLALKKQIESIEGHKEVLNKIAMVNANQKCRAILRSLPLDSEPTIEQMVETCTRHTPLKTQWHKLLPRALQMGYQEPSQGLLQKTTSNGFAVGTLVIF